MSLYSSLQLANNSLRASQIGLQVVGQNIANANTPGYVRAEVMLAPSNTQRHGGLLLGMGVQVQGVVQKIDNFLESRLRSAISDTSGAQVQEQAYIQLEELLGELTDSDLSTSLNNFFNSIAEVLNQPESVSVRNLVVLQGDTLASHIRRFAAHGRQIATNLNTRVNNATDDINRLTSEIQALNVRITEIEGGRTSKSDAVGLRDQRLVALTELSKLVNIKVVEHSNGTLGVYTGGDYLVLGGERRELKAVDVSQGGLPRSEVRLISTDAPLQITGGELDGLITARDSTLAGFLDDLDNFAATLAFEFNKVFSSGQGLTGYTSITSEFAVDDAQLSLDAAGLSFTPVNGSFEVLRLNKHTGLTQTTRITVDLNGFDEDTSLADLAAALNEINGLSAEVTDNGRLAIKSDAPDTTFSFSNDTSGVLAALGINTFFSGSSAGDISINQAIAKDPAKFAASAGGIGEDTAMAVKMAAFIDRPLETANGQSLAFVYDRFTSKVTQASTVAQSVASGFRSFEHTLLGEKLAISGVSIDEEAIRMISYQRTFQASAKYISTVSELLELLVNL